MSGNFARGSRGIAIAPKRTITMVQTVVRTGFLIKTSAILSSIDPAGVGEEREKSTSEKIDRMTN
jgi:hypothetical protein